MSRYLKIKATVLLILFFLAVVLGVFNGAVKIPLAKLFLGENQPILYLRLLRLAMAIIAGVGLAVCGIVLQAILKNALAEPYLLGTSSGAGLGAVVAIILGFSGIYLPLAAFAGAIFSMLLVYNLAKENNKIPEQSLILSGVIISVVFSAVIVFLVSISNNLALQGITWWLWGNLQVYDAKLLLVVSAFVLLAVAIIYLFSQDLNAISIGEEEAIHLGIEVESVKKILILLTALITASLVSLCGIIGFVGLIIPHLMRLLVGPNHKVLIPLACLAAAAFMVTCDILSRTLFVPVEIPIGVITALAGAPTFIFLVKRKQKHG